MTSDDKPVTSYDLSFIRPDRRYFVQTWHSKGEPFGHVTKILERFGNDRETIREFLNRVRVSRDVAFSFIYGSAVNSNLTPSEIEDVDILVVTRGRNKFVYEWEAPRGSEIRYMRLSEMRDFLRARKRLFSYDLTGEFNTLGGILVNGLVVIKGSDDLDTLVREARGHFHRVHIGALSQMVENDCRKRSEKRNRFPETKTEFPPNDKRRYSFYGSKNRVTLDEARSAIDESIRRKNIQPGKAPAIARKILKRIKMRRMF